MRRFWMVLTIMLVLAYGTWGSLGLVPAQASRHLHSASLKKCHTITKKVHRKKKRVRVCTAVKRKPTATPIPTLTIPPVGRVVAQVSVTDPFNVTVAFGSVWVNRGLSADSDVVTRIDPATNQVTASIHVDRLGGQVIAAGFGSIWEVDNGSGMISRIDPQSNAVVARISTQGTSPIGIAISSQAVWVANHNEPAVPNGAAIVKIDPATNHVVDTIPVGDQYGGPGWITSGSGSIWAFDQSTESVDRIDPTSDKIVAAIPSIGGCICRTFAADDSHVWVSIPAEGSTIKAEVMRIDPTTNTSTIAVPNSTLAHYGVRNVYDLELGGGSLWLSGPCGQTACVLRVDPDTNAVVSAWTVPVIGNADDLTLTFAYADGSLWFSGIGGNRVLRLDVSS